MFTATSTGFQLDDLSGNRKGMSLISYLVKPPLFTIESMKKSAESSRKSLGLYWGLRGIRDHLVAGGHFFLKINEKSLLIWIHLNTL